MKRLLLKIIVLSVFILSFSCFASQKIESLTFNQTKLSLVLEILSKKTGSKLIPGSDIADKPITAYLENVSAEQAIESILAANGLYRQKLPDSDVYIVYSEQKKLSPQKPVSACFQLKHAFASDIATELKNIGFEKSIAVDNRTNTIVVKDTPANVEIIKAIVENLDVEHKNLPVKTTVYSLKYVTAGDIWPVVLSVVKKNKGDKDTQSKAEITIGTNTKETGDLGTASAGVSSATTSGTTGTTSSGTTTGTGTGTTGTYPTLTGQKEKNISGKVQISTDISTGFSILPDERTNSLILVGTQDFLDEVTSIISSLDTPAVQVSIEAMIVELTEDATKNLGITWTDNSGNLATITGTLTTSIPGWDTSGTIAWSNLVVNIKALQTKGEANILANPRVTTLNGTPATIRITSNIPVAPKVTTTSTGGTGTTVTEYEYRDIGIILVAVPYVGNNNTVTMEVMPKVISAKQSAFFKDAVETSERSTLTKVNVKNGETIVIGGLLSTENIKGENKVPVLGNVLPFLFSNKNRQMKKTDLVIFLTPRIITEQLGKRIAEEEKSRTGVDKGEQ
ncbi:MAG TPA: secretin N-terminal domain-containing protein [bacterium]|nr:secretin N-terminal domain-containing protein [bacterium]HOL34338.1 secretin N-terminal domain-containing protein [bacterium]HPP08000.1 secretin N-terminal domain-containing protein [bacterium]